jgi:hypothetical protein
MRIESRANFGLKRIESSEWGLGIRDKIIRGEGGWIGGGEIDGT